MASRTESWIQDAVSDTEKGQRCASVAVIHLSNGPEGPYQIDRVALNGITSVQQIAKRFDHRVADYCRDKSGPQSCKLFAFYDDSQEPGAELPFIVKGSADLGIGGKEEPNERGLLVMVMKHQEAHTQMYLAAQRALLEGFGQLASASQQQVANAVLECNTLRTELGEAYKIVREVTLADHMESLDRDMVMLKARKAEEFQRALLQWAPALVNTILQKKVFPEAMEDTAIVNGILDAMGPDQIAMFVGMLPPQISGVIASRANELMRRREELAKGQADARQLSTGLSTESELQ